jgi:hypothetical protein
VSASTSHQFKGIVKRSLIPNENKYSTSLLETLKPLMHKDFLNERIIYIYKECDNIKGGDIIK